MSNLQYRQSKIQEKRKQTPWRDFVMECASWEQFNFYKIDSKTSRYPQTDRIGKLVDAKDFFEVNEGTGIDYDISLSFFENYRKLRSHISLPYLWQFGPGVDNSEYADTTFNSKNCYLSVAGCFDVENVLYSLECMGNLTNIISCVGIHSNSTNVFQCSGIADSYNIFYSYNIQNSSDIRFSSNLTGCKHCIQCTNLTNQSYCINNQQYTEQEYQQQKTLILSQKSTFDNLYAQVDRSANATLGCHNVTSSHLVSYINNAHNVCLVGGDREIKRSDLYDVWSSGGNLSDAYGCMGVSPGDNFYHVINSAFGSNLYYCYFMTECSFCLGCISLKNKSYCILNKQYTKEEWYEKVDEIFSQMETDGTLGQFFPASMNPFYFNDTAAYLIDPSFTKEEVVAKGYLWRDEPIKVDIPEWMEVVKSSELTSYEYRVDEKGNKIDSLGTRDPLLATEAKRYIDPIILKKTIRDEEGNVYRVIKLEYDFLVKYGLPLPRKHWLTRMKENFRIS